MKNTSSTPNLLASSATKQRYNQSLVEAKQYLQTLQKNDFISPNFIKKNIQQYENHEGNEF